MTDTDLSVTYAYALDSEFPTMRRACETCEYWDAEQAINGYATCYQLVYSRNGWRLDVLDKLPLGIASIVRTHKNFNCAYYEWKQPSN